MENSKEIKLQKPYKLRPHQKQAVKFMGRGSLVSLFTGCVDRDTEFLTPSGWKKIGDYQEGDLVAEWEMQDKPLLNVRRCEITFKEPSEYIKNPKENLTRVKTKEIDMVVSDNHKVPHLDHGAYKSKRWEELRDNSDINIPRSFTIGEDSPPLDISNSLIRVLVLQSVKGDNFSITLKKEGEKTRVLQLLRSAKISYTLHESGEGSTQVRYSPPKEIDQKGLSLLWGANKEQLKLIRREIMFWGDSHFIGSYKDAEFVQYCFSVISGNYVSMEEEHKKAYKVEESSRRSSTIPLKDNKESVTLYKTLDGFEYCFTTSSGYWLARRNGKIFPTGNSGKTLISFTHFYKKEELWKCLYLTENNLISNVLQDHKKFYGYHDNLQMLKGALPAKRRKTYKEFSEDERLDFLVMNYHTATNDLSEIFKMIDSLKEEGYKLLVVLDEVEIARKESTHFYQTLEALREEVEEVKGFSATPLKKGLVEIYNILTLLEGKPPIKKKKFHKKYCDIVVNKIFSFNHKGKRKGYPLKASSQLGEKTTTLVVPFWLFKGIETKGGLLSIEGYDAKKVSLEYLKGSGLILTIPIEYEGLLKFVYARDTFSVYVSSRTEVKGYKKIKSFKREVSSLMFSISKRNVEGFPTFVNKTILVERDKKTRKTLEFLYGEEKNLNASVEAIAEVAPEVTNYEYNLKEEVALNPSPLLKKVLKDTYKLFKKGEIVILFVPFTTITEYIEMVVEKHYKKMDLRVIVGGVKKEVLEKIKEDATNSKPMVIMMNEAGIRGLNLQTCRHIKTIIAPKSGGDLIQLCGRVSRLGSKHKKVYLDMYYIKESVLEDLHKVCMGEMALIEEFNEELLEKGFKVDKDLKKIVIKEGDYIKEKLKNRKEEGEKKER